MVMTKTAKRLKAKAKTMPKFPVVRYSAMDGDCALMYDSLDELACEHSEDSPWVAVYKLDRVTRLKRTGATLED